MVDTVRPHCSPSPRSHDLRAQLQFSVGGQWLDRGRTAVRVTIPDAAGFAVELGAPCQEGVWRTRVVTDGIGPGGTPFTYTDTGAEREFSLVECAR
ncbi:hypothetical protein ACTG9Q_31610 [Actinokineospora sp. 24-640]